MASFLSIHALGVDVTLAFLAAFTILCRIEPSWIAKNQSFPYTSQPEWNYGLKAFDFQLLVFEFFHTEWFSRAVHIVSIVTEGFLWHLIIQITFGIWGTGFTLTLMALQAFSFADVFLATTIMAMNTLYACLSCAILFDSVLTPAFLLNIAKVALFWMVAARTLNHAFEPLPPKYSVQIFDDNFGFPGYTLIRAEPLRSLWLMALGQVSEFGAGLPGRFFNQITYKIMWKAGYRSKTLLDVAQVKKQAQMVIKGGWKAHPTTAVLYQWATKRCEEKIIKGETGALVTEEQSVVDENLF